MKFYSNENFPQPVVRALRESGYDVLTSLDAGRANQRVPDEEVLKFATQENRVLLTINRKDFIQLHSENSLHAGIIVCTQDPDFAGQARRIAHAVTQTRTMRGHLLRVNRADK
ncbi:MAG: DUF5615 family PIN-like protein [Verrucomicrobia bacterium]|nr:DUF5615 family PIN-like protein [Verrucomicrobiota bacterium]